MSLPYFPMFPADFEAKTSHLTLIEDGAYNRLLRLCWMMPGCSLPNDEAWIMRRARATTDDEKQAVRTILAEFFTVLEGRYSNARLAREWTAANEAHAKRVQAGAKGGKAKAMKTNDTAPSNAGGNATAMPKQPEPEPYVEDTDVSSRPRKRASRLPETWALPLEWGQWAITEGWAETVIRSEADKFRDYWIGRGGKDAAKADWQATWRNWMRNSKAPKIVDGGGYERPAKSTERLRAFIGGAD